jgi:hypothetical protein
VTAELGMAQFMSDEKGIHEAIACGLVEDQPSAGVEKRSTPTKANVARLYAFDFELAPACFS